MLVATPDKRQIRNVLATPAGRPADCRATIRWDMGWGARDSSTYLVPFAPLADSMKWAKTLFFGPNWRDSNFSSI